MISAIVAVDNDWGIGFNGDLLEHIPADLKHFKELTLGNIIVMGRKTWDSLPKKPLSNRHNVIISSTLPSTQFPQIITNMEIPVTIITLDDFINGGRPLKKRQYPTDVFVIGGGQIYEELLPYCERVYVTKIFKDHENIDTYFPNLDELDEWTLGESSEVYEYNDFTYQFCQYNRL